MTTEKINTRVNSIAKQFVDIAKIEDDFLVFDTEAKKPGTKTMDSFRVTGTEDLYQVNLPEGITLETLKTIDDYNKDFNAGCLLGLGNFTANEINKNKDIFYSACYTPMTDRQTLSTSVFIQSGIYDKEIIDLRFDSNIKENLPPERETGEATQKEHVQMHLRELYLNALEKD